MEKNSSFWHTVSPGEEVPKKFNVVIETPRGSKNKFEMSKQFPGIVLDRVLHSSVVYPVEYGAIPGTLYDDGDPIDVMVLTSIPTFPGVVLEARPIGVMKMIDQGDKDNKILAVATKDPNYRHVKSLKDVPEHLLDEITNFFQTYKILEKKKTEVSGWEGQEFAEEEIKRSVESYRQKFSL
ncbi:MAG: inorganic diphosphatase [Candidatus Thermoplasmatota archaeon]|jgi:inorganic pyrophosphatase|nr:inorganic diphosphatase [Candidatus Thermoplasmatota archaeon]